jgi:hypothetical protein
MALVLRLIKIKDAFDVQDFSHIRNTPSPNWVHMDAPDMSREWPTKILENVEEIESSLKNILLA